MILGIVENISQIHSHRKMVLPRIFPQEKQTIIFKAAKLRDFPPTSCI